MKCQFCQKEIADGTKFCKYCGKEQQAVPSSGNYCPACGAANSANAAFCAGCGAPLAQPGGMRRKNTEAGKQKDGGKGIGKKVVLVLVIIAIVLGAAALVIRFLMGGTSNGKLSKNAFTKYLEYIGTEFAELPDSFETETLTETEMYDVMAAESEVTYAKLDGVIRFIGYEPADGVTWKELEEIFTAGDPRTIKSVSWTPEEFGADTEEQILEQLVKDYGEYDGKEKHTVPDGSGGNLLKYTFYYWSEGNYDIEFVLLEAPDGYGVIDTPGYVSIASCEGESDSEYRKPLEKFEQAVKENDVETWKEAFSDSFIEEIDDEEIEELLAKASEVSFDIQEAEKLEKGYQMMILVNEFELPVSDVTDVTEAYWVEAEAKADVDGETETDTMQFILGKKNGEWKIFYMDEQ